MLLASIKIPDNEKNELKAEVKQYNLNGGLNAANRAWLRSRNNLYIFSPSRFGLKSRSD